MLKDFSQWKLLSEQRQPYKNILLLCPVVNIFSGEGIIMFMPLPMLLFWIHYAETKNTETFFPIASSSAHSTRGSSGNTHMTWVNEEKWKGKKFLCEQLESKFVKILPAFDKGLPPGLMRCSLSYHNFYPVSMYLLLVLHVLRVAGCVCSLHPPVKHSDYKSTWYTTITNTTPAGFEPRPIYHLPVLRHATK